MIQMSVLASPGGVPPGQCHCSQREEFVSEPSSSAKHVVGSSKTSVLTSSGFDGLNSPWSSQNRAVSVSSGSMTTRNFSLASAARSFVLLGNDISGLKPWQKYP